MSLDGVWAEASGAPVGSVMLKGIKITKYPNGVICVFDCFSSSLIYPYLSERFLIVLLKYGWKIGVNNIIIMKCDERLAQITENIRLEILNKHNKRKIKLLKEQREELIIVRDNAHSYINKKTN